MKRFLAMLLAVVLVIGVVPMGALAEEEGGAKAGETSYLSQLKFKYGSNSAKEVTPDESGTYNVVVPSNADSASIWVTVAKDAAPEGYTVYAKYKNTAGEDKNIKVSMITNSNISKERSLTSVIAQGMIGNTVTVTVGTESDMQSFTLNITRTPSVGITAMTDGDGTALEKDGDAYILPDTQKYL